MSEPGARRMTYAEYLALEEASETKHEFVDAGRAMAGGTVNTLACRPARSPSSRWLANVPREPLLERLRVHVLATDARATSGRVREVERSAADPHAGTNPIVIVILAEHQADDAAKMGALPWRSVASSLRPRLPTSPARRVYTRIDLGWHYARCCLAAPSRSRPSMRPSRSTSSTQAASAAERVDVRFSDRDTSDARRRDAARKGSDRGAARRASR